MLERRRACRRPATEKPAGADPWVDPDDPVGEAGQALHLAADEHRIAPLPAVGEDHDDGAAGHAAAPVAVVELLQRVADPGAARPVAAPPRRRAGSPAPGCRGRAPGSAGSAGWRRRTPRRRGRRRRRRRGTAGRRGRRAPSTRRCRRASPAGGGPYARRRRATSDRVAAGSQAARAGSGAGRPPAVATRARGGGCAAAASRARAATSAGGAAPAPSGSSASKLLPASRSSSLAIGQRNVDLGSALRSPRARRRRPVGAGVLRPPSAGLWSRARTAAARRPAPDGAGVVARRPSVGRRARRRPSRRRASKAAASSGRRRRSSAPSSTAAGGSAGGPGSGPAAKSRRSLRGHGHAGLAQAAAERPGQRRQVEVDRLDPERAPGGVGLSHDRPRAARGRQREPPPGPRRT